jgi:signal transduction histidine kinase
MIAYGLLDLYVRSLLAFRGTMLLLAAFYLLFWLTDLMSLVRAAYGVLLTWVSLAFAILLVSAIFKRTVFRDLLRSYLSQERLSDVREANDRSWPQLWIPSSLD